MKSIPFAAILFLVACGGGDNNNPAESSPNDTTDNTVDTPENQTFSVANTNWKWCVPSPGMNSPVDGAPLPYNGSTLSFTEATHRQVTGFWNDSDCSGTPIDGVTTILSGTYEIGGTRTSTEGLIVYDVTYTDAFEGLGLDPLPRDDILFLDNGTLYQGFGRFEGTVPSINFNVPLTPDT